MSWLQRTLAILATVVTILAGVWFKAESTGSAKAVQKAYEKDNDNAQKIKDNVDRAIARPIDDADSVLRKAGRLRD